MFKRKNKKEPYNEWLAQQQEEIIQIIEEQHKAIMQLQENVLKLRKLVEKGEA